MRVGVPKFARNGADVGMVFEFLLRGHKLGYCLSMSYFKVNEQLHFVTRPDRSRTEPRFHPEQWIVYE